MQTDGPTANVLLLLVLCRYGPTECTICCVSIDVTNYDADGVASVPIGKPGINQPCYVLDASMRMCPVGVPGELVIGGAGVA
eukprot:242636-Chlamydomonas_euryale.AAC.1